MADAKRYRPPYTIFMETEKPLSGSIKSLSLFLGSSYLTAAIGGIATASSVKTWYQHLDRPEWSPPDWLFGPVWSALYTMMAIAAWMVWSSPSKDKAKALGWYWLQLGLNGAWSWLFFFLRSPLAGLAEIVLLLLAIVKTIREFFSVRPAAAALLIPYLFWVSFATLLNLAIALRNRM